MVCEKPGEICCSVCSLKFIRVNRNCHLGGISIWPGAFYGDELARIIVAAKDEEIQLLKQQIGQMKEQNSRLIEIVGERIQKGC